MLPGRKNLGVFKVYLRMEYGTGTVGVGDCIASISGQAMAAAAAWDGKIEIEEKVEKIWDKLTFNFHMSPRN